VEPRRAIHDLALVRERAGLLVALGRNEEAKAEYFALLGRAPTHESLYRSTRELCESRLPERSIFRLLAAKAHEWFPDDAFADLYIANGKTHAASRAALVVRRDSPPVARASLVTPREALAASREAPAGR